MPIVTAPEATGFDVRRCPNLTKCNPWFAELMTAMSSRDVYWPRTDAMARYIAELLRGVTTGEYNVVEAYKAILAIPEDIRPHLGLLLHGLDGTEPSISPADFETLHIMAQMKTVPWQRVEPKSAKFMATELSKRQREHVPLPREFKKQIAKAVAEPTQLVGFRLIVDESRVLNYACSLLQYLCGLLNKNSFQHAQAVVRDSIGFLSSLNKYKPGNIEIIVAILQDWLSQPSGSPPPRVGGLMSMKEALIVAYQKFSRMAGVDTTSPNFSDTLVTNGLSSPLLGFQYDNRWSYLSLSRGLFDAYYQATTTDQPVPMRWRYGLVPAKAMLAAWRDEGVRLGTLVAYLDPFQPVPHKSKPENEAVISWHDRAYHNAILNHMPALLQRAMRDVLVVFQQTFGDRCDGLIETALDAELPTVLRDQAYSPSQLTHKFFSAVFPKGTSHHEGLLVLMDIARQPEKWAEILALLDKTGSSKLLNYALQNRALLHKYLSGAEDPTQDVVKFSLEPRGRKALSEFILGKIQAGDKKVSLTWEVDGDPTAGSASVIVLVNQVRFSLRDLCKKKSNPADLLEKMQAAYDNGPRFRSAASGAADLPALVPVSERKLKK